MLLHIDFVVNLYWTQYSELSTQDLKIGNLGGDNPFANIATTLAKPSAENSRFIGENAKQIANSAIFFGEIAISSAARERRWSIEVRVTKR